MGLLSTIGWRCGSLSEQENSAMNDAYVSIQMTGLARLCYQLPSKWAVQIGIHQVFLSSLRSSRIHGLAQRGLADPSRPSLAVCRSRRLLGDGGCNVTSLGVEDLVGNFLDRL